MNKSDNRIVSNVIWRYMERIGAEGVSFVISIVIARILEPEAYGVVAIVTVLLSILMIFVNSGMGTALIQKKNVDDQDYSSIFWFNIFFCIALYLLLFFAAPILASIYHMESLVPLTRVLGLTLIISGIKNIESAYISRNMQFKKFFFATLLGTVCAGFVGIVMAVNHLGVWALVAQSLVNNLIDTVVLWFSIKWRPKLLFSRKRLTALVSFGWKVLAADLFDTVYNNIRTLIIGIKYSSSDLAYFNRGKSFPSLIMNNIDTSISSVLLPVVSSVQDSPEKVKALTRRTIKTGTFLLMPLMAGLMACSEPLIRLLLTDKWASCVPYMRIFAFTMAFSTIITANDNAIKAVGRSDIYLKNGVKQKIIGLTAVLITMWISVQAIAYSLIVVCFANQIICASANKKLIDYGYFEQLRDIFPHIGLSVVMGVSVYCISLLGLQNLLTLFLQVILGVVIYCGGAMVLKFESFKFLLSYLKKHVYFKQNR